MTTAPDLALQDAVVSALKADAAVAAIVGTRIYDGVPADAKLPYISIGPSDTAPDEADCLPADMVTLQIDIWCRDQGKKHPARTLTRAVREALHQVEADLADPLAAATMEVVATQVLDDPDGITAHGIVTLQAVVERV